MHSLCKSSVLTFTFFPLFFFVYFSAASLIAETLTPGQATDRLSEDSEHEFDALDAYYVDLPSTRESCFATTSIFTHEQVYINLTIPFALQEVYETPCDIYRHLE